MAGCEDASGEVEDCVLRSDAAVAELEAIVNINEFRKRARELGLVIQHRNPDGGWRHRSRADILEDFRRLLKVQGRDAMRRRAVDLGMTRDKASDRPGAALKRPASSTFGHEVSLSKEGTEGLESTGDNGLNLRGRP